MAPRNGTLATLSVPQRDALASAAPGAVREFLWSDLIALVVCGFAGAALNAVLGHETADGRFVVAVIGTLGVVYAFRSLGHYRARKALGDQIKPMLHVCGLTFLATSTAELALGESGLSAGTALKWSLAPVILLSLRYLVREGMKSRNAWFEPIVLVSSTGGEADQRALLATNEGHGLMPVRSVALSSFGGLDDAALGARLDQFQAERLFLAPSVEDQPIAARIATRLSARGASFYYKPALGRIPTENVDVLDAPPSDGFVLRMGDSLDRPVARSLKRGFDVLAAGCALVILTPVLGLIAAAIRRDGGPALFVQSRAGERGKPFGCYKFRTMAIDAESRLEAILAADPNKRAEWDAFQKLDDDPRITAVGRFLRKTSLDELPQLINVVKGEMSLIGPRPMMLDQMERYGASLEAYVRMRPGITGLWQVNGRNATTFEERARLDDWYARNWSLWRDCVILLRTVRELLGGSGR